MATVSEHIRLLAIYFTDDQLTEIFGVHQTDIITAFRGLKRPKANPIALPLLLARLSEVASAFVRPSRATLESEYNKGDEELIAKLSMSISAVNFLNRYQRRVGSESDTRLTNRLKAAGIRFVWELVQKTSDQLRNQCGIGDTSIGYIEHTLRSLGLSLEMSPHHPAMTETKRRGGFDHSPITPTQPASP